MSESLAIALAFAMSLVTAGSNVLLKKGFARIDPRVGVYLSVAISSLLLWLLTFLVVDRAHFQNHRGILVFMLVGSFAPTLVRTMTYVGIHRLGAGRAAPLRAMTPFFATLAAIIFLKESPRPAIFIGIALIVYGIVVIGGQRGEANASYRMTDMMYPLGAAFLAGLAANLRKYGLDIMPQPVLASAVAATTSWAVLSLPLVLDPAAVRRHVEGLAGRRRELLYLLAASLMVTVGEIIDLSALMFGRVSLVVPIFAVTPLLVVLLSALFLRRHEQVTRAVWLGALLIVAGLCVTVRSAARG